MTEQTGNPTVYWYQKIVDGERWDDLRAPASGINPAGSASPPDEDTTNGGLLFSNTTDEIVAVQFQLPHNWLEGSTLKPHCHWQKTTSASGTVAWKFAYKWAPINEVMDTSFTTSTSTTTVDGTPDTNTANKHLITAFDDIDGTGKGISDMLMVIFSRDVSEDNYAADARLLEIDIHIQVDSMGSEVEFRKQITLGGVGI